MKEDAIDTWRHSFTMLCHVLIPATASAVISDPTIATTASNYFLQALFGVQSRIKQQRVELMLNNLESMLRSYDPDFDMEKASTEELRDLFETAIINASKANSKSKIDRLRQVLFGQIVSPQPFDYTSRYLDLALRLNDTQVKILRLFTDTEEVIRPIREELKEATENLRLGKDMEPNFTKSDSKASPKQKEIYFKKLKESERRLDDVRMRYETEFNKRHRGISEIPEDEFPFLFNDLRVLGLVYNPAEGRVSNTGEPRYYQCTALAMGFMRFLIEE